MLAAAKEFNIGKETLIDFLTNKGFDMDGFGSPNARLNAVMYSALQSEFQQDKANKKKSDQIALPKGSVLETAKKKEKEEAEAAAKKKDAAKDKEEVVPVAEVPKVESKPEPKPEPKAEAPKPEPKEDPKQEPVAAKEAPKAQPEPAPAAAPPVAEAPKQQHAEPAAAPEVTKTEAPRINSPKVVATIDLDALNNPNRKKAGVKKNEDKAPQ